MGFGDDILKDYKKIEAKRDRAIKSAVVNLRSDLIKASPVGNPDLWNVPYKPKGYSGGELRISWEQPKQIGKRKWVITNIAPHAPIIDGGRREVPTKGGGKKWIGSTQLKEGFGDIVADTEKELKRVFKSW